MRARRNAQHAQVPKQSHWIVSGKASYRRAGLLQFMQAFSEKSHLRAPWLALKQGQALPSNHVRSSNDARTGDRRSRPTPSTRDSQDYANRTAHSDEFTTLSM